MTERKNVVGHSPKFFELDKIESVDIDDFIDFKIAELLYQQLGIEWLMQWNLAVKGLDVYKRFFHFLFKNITLVLLFRDFMSMVRVWSKLK